MNHIVDIKKDATWLAQIISNRIRNKSYNYKDLECPQLSTKSLYSQFIADMNMSVDERILFIAALIPNIINDFYIERLSEKYFDPNERGMASRPIHNTGYVKSPSSESYLPTGHTILYIIAGNDLIKKAELIEYFTQKKFLTIEKEVITLLPIHDYEPLLSNTIVMNQDYALRFIINKSNVIFNLNDDDKKNNLQAVSEPK